MDQIRVGHWTDTDTATGLSVFIPPAGSVVAGLGHGQNTGTLNLHALGLDGVSSEADAIVLTGGSTNGLASAMELHLELDRRTQHSPGNEKAIPTVAAAVVYDIRLGERSRPAADAAVLAYDAAVPGSRAQRGCVGVGTGTLSGAVLGIEHATKAGFGYASRELHGGLQVSAWVAANPVGDIVDTDGTTLAGAHVDGNFVGVTEHLCANGSGEFGKEQGMATTLVVVATNARLDKRRAWLLARDAHLGIARAVHPSASAFDGDTAFAIATGEVETQDLFMLESAAIAVVADAIRDAARAATDLHGSPSGSTLRGGATRSAEPAAALPRVAEPEAAR
ncbi:P1 family peptidase [Paeniglutamicibacter sp. R2-26]|uniref:P1 family peptidase n=1 Tax=Paeniglutamicibacter sp. R2-26 TaxID=3144417 RepID=UPI003EE5ECBC